MKKGVGLHQSIRTKFEEKKRKSLQCLFFEPQRKLFPADSYITVKHSWESHGSPRSQLSGLPQFLKNCRLGSFLPDKYDSSSSSGSNKRHVLNK